MEHENIKKVLQLPMTLAQCRAIQDNLGCICVQVRVPASIHSKGIDALNDYVSEAVTGDSAALEDISYKILSSYTDFQDDTASCLLVKATGNILNWAEHQDERDGTPVLSPRRVVCAAILLDSGDVICGARHFDNIMRAQLSRHHPGDKVNIEQGFIDQFGVYMSREEALDVALKNNQRIRRCGGDEKKLFSENLY